ncbi:hypothetical protein ACGFR8_36835 [Streptomyces brevispora]|uniref:hypothetical protein n=1 Tax=Streptomyces brevispora TaxID=887462 RepID=UPI00371F79AB
MAPRIPRLRRKPAAIPFQPLRSRSFGALGSDVCSATDVLDRYERRTNTWAPHATTGPWNSPCLDFAQPSSQPAPVPGPGSTPADDTCGRS